MYRSKAIILPYILGFYLGTKIISYGSFYLPLILIAIYLFILFLTRKYFFAKTTPLIAKLTYFGTFASFIAGLIYDHFRRG